MLPEVSQEKVTVSFQVLINERKLASRTPRNTHVGISHIVNDDRLGGEIWVW